MTLEIKDLQVKIEEKDILKGINLKIEKGKVYALMGPNGSGKSTLAKTLMGHPQCEITSGTMSIEGEEINEASPDERAKKGLFLSFQYPKEIGGITLMNFLRAAYNAQREEKISIIDFNKLLKTKMKELGIDPSMARRHLNKGFSGGEKKKAEMLQMSVLEPTYAILDETDSGLDVDALRIVAGAIKALQSPERAIVLITHYNRILEYVTPDEVIILKEGKITKQGDKTLAKQIEEQGFDDAQ